MKLLLVQVKVVSPLKYCMPARLAMAKLSKYRVSATSAAVQVVSIYQPYMQDGNSFCRYLRKLVSGISTKFATGQPLGLRLLLQVGYVLSECMKDVGWS